MAKYTTLVRSICESKSGLLQSVGGNSVDDVIAKSWDKIFTTKAEFFNEDHRQVICSKILKHYYMREIGAETVGLWMMWMNTRLEEIMPYYNQMYESETMKYDPLTDVKYKREFDRATEKTTNDKTTFSSESGSHMNTSSTGKNTNRFSDTPQGSVQNLENNSYLTNATIDDRTDSSEGSQNANSSGNSTNNGAEDGTEHFVEEISGKHGSSDYATMIMKYRDTILNIDMMVIEEFRDLFMLLY